MINIRTFQKKYKRSDKVNNTSELKQKEFPLNGEKKKVFKLERLKD